MEELCIGLCTSCDSLFKTYDKFQTRCYTCRNLSGNHHLSTDEYIKKIASQIMEEDLSKFDN